MSMASMRQQPQGTQILSSVPNSPKHQAQGSRPKPEQFQAKGIQQKQNGQRDRREKKIQWHAKEEAHDAVPYSNPQAGKKLLRNLASLDFFFVPKDIRTRLEVIKSRLIPSQEQLLFGIFIYFSKSESERHPLALGRSESIDERGGKDDDEANIGGKGRGQSSSRVRKKKMRPIYSSSSVISDCDQ